MEQDIRIRYTIKFEKNMRWDIDYNDDSRDEAEEIAHDIEKHPNDYTEGNITDIDLTEVSF